MSKISYLILHFERPYLLDINVKILRKFLPEGSQIIVADDGSHKKVISQFDRIGIDDLYHNVDNKNLLTEGTCSTTIKRGRKLIKHDYAIFAEDDFIFVPNPITDINQKGLHIEEESNKIIPNTDYNSKFNFFNECVDLLEKDDSIKNIQMARDSVRVATTGEFNTSNVSWTYVDSLKKLECYYCNWPNMWRTDEFREVFIPEGYSIWKYEGFIAKRIQDKFRSFGKWAVCPKNRFYLHLGFPFSKRPNGAKGIEKRKTDLERIQNSVYNKIINNNIKDFNSFLTKQWVQGNFVIELEEVLSNGLNFAYWNALKRIEGELC